MKKLLSFFAVLLVSLSGCFSSQPETPAENNTPPVPASSTDFESVMTQMHNAYSQKVLSLFPNKDIPEIYTEDFTFAGTAIPPEGMGVEKVDFNVTANSASDISDATNPQAEGTLRISANVLGNQVSGEGHIEVMTKMVNQKIMASLQGISFSSPAMPLPIDVLAAPYLKKWYGASFDEVDSMMLNTFGENPGFHFPDLFQNPNQLLGDMKNRVDNALSKVHMWKLEKTLPEEDGMLRYEVSLDKDQLKTGILEIIKVGFTNLDGSLNPEYNQAKADVEAAFEQDFTVQGILSVDKTNVKYFSFVGTASGASGSGEINTLYKADHILFSAKEAVTGDEVIFEKKNDTYSLMAEGQEIISGTHTDTKLTGTMSDNGAEMVNFAFTKQAEQNYSGTITMPMGNVEISIQEFSYSDLSMNLQMSVQWNTQTVFEGSMVYQAAETNSFTVAEPEMVLPFADLLMGIPGIAPLPIPVEAGEGDSLE